MQDDDLSLDDVLDILRDAPTDLERETLARSLPMPVCIERGSHRWVRYENDATGEKWRACGDCGISSRGARDDQDAA